ncbi:hypothetical protein ACJRO7_021396 [Eucalyptus globulus]|uniref:Methyltransferase type 11 domain-containing protein n=1 Tax=Eucalyptus globulus TaxID=34317 RepID=A0ABD3KRC6_EUCGL
MNRGKFLLLLLLRSTRASARATPRKSGQRLLGARARQLARASACPNLREARSRARAPIEYIDPIVVDEKVASKKGILACPICYHPLTHAGPALSMDTLSESTLLCSTCKKTYLGNKTHLELVASSGAKEYTEAMAPATEFFRLLLISYIYERGWRQGFSVVGGWPGPQKEFELIKGYLEPVLGGNIIDANCGSGPFTRLFTKSGLFSLVVALDYSENMLRECYEFIKKEENFPKEDLILVRADISRLPFVSGSVDAVHVGAAVHCWVHVEMYKILFFLLVLVVRTLLIKPPAVVAPLVGSMTSTLEVWSLKPLQRKSTMSGRRDWHILHELPWQYTRNSRMSTNGNGYFPTKAWLKLGA